MRIAAAVAFVTVIATGAPAPAADRAIEKQVVVKASVEDVWNAWTTREGITSFFAPDANIDARPDGAFEIYFNPYAAAGSKGADGMRFLALQPRSMLSFTWNAPPSFPEVRGQRTSVVVRMQPAGEGTTRVTLTHAGWGDGGQWDEVYAYFDKAWGNVLASLQKRFVDGPVDFKPFLERLKAQADAKTK